MKKLSLTLTSTQIQGILNIDRDTPLSHIDILAIIVKLSSNAEGDKLLTTANGAGDVLYYSLTPTQVAKLAMHTRNDRLKEIGDMMLNNEKRAKLEKHEQMMRNLTPATQEPYTAGSDEEPLVTNTPDPAMQELLEEIYALQIAVADLKTLTECSVCNYLRRAYYSLVSFVQSWT